MSVLTFLRNDCKQTLGAIFPGKIRGKCGVFSRGYIWLPNLCGSLDWNTWRAGRPHSAEASADVNGCGSDRKVPRGKQTANAPELSPEEAK
ncbi:hypothetical protein MTP99_000370 [Tenebrio molitor]|nr:hypothetical protein MTP99_000370 [Tenebrio molitor]